MVSSRLENHGHQLIKIDFEDEWILSSRTWYINKLGYVASDSKPRTTLHRLLMKPPKGYVVDHKNGNKLDNRKCNLRVCRQIKNTWNALNHKDKLKGFYYHKSSKLYHSRITINKNVLNLGYFKTPEEAHIMYCMAAIYYFKEFANPGY